MMNWRKCQQMLVLVPCWFTSTLITGLLILQTEAHKRFSIADSKFTCKYLKCKTKVPEFFDTRVLFSTLRSCAVCREHLEADLRRNQDHQH